MHLLSNLFSLWRVGPLVENAFGPACAYLLYLLCGISGNVVGLAFGSGNGMSVGASGAVFGMMGATGGYVVRNKRALGRYGDMLLQNVGQILLINLFIGTRRGSGIDNLAHVGGFAAGAVFGAVLAPSVDKRSDGSNALLPPWAIRGMLAAIVVLYATGIREGLRIARAIVRVYGRV